MKYTVIIIQGYELQSADGQLHNSTTIELIEDNPDIALKKAKKLIKKKEYRVANIIERFKDVNTA